MEEPEWNKPEPVFAHALITPDAFAIGSEYMSSMLNLLSHSKVSVVFTWLINV